MGLLLAASHDRLVLSCGTDSMLCLWRATSAGSFFARFRVHACAHLLRCLDPLPGGFSSAGRQARGGAEKRCESSAWTGTSTPPLQEAARASDGLVRKYEEHEESEGKNETERERS